MKLRRVRAHGRLVSLAALVLLIASLAPSANAMRTRVRRLVISTPASASTVVGSTVDIAYSVSGDLTGVNHVHFQIDGGPELMDPAPIDGVFRITDVPPGPHTLDGFLVREDHAKVAGSSAVTVHFYVASSASDPAVVGQWAAPVPLPTVAVDLVLLHTGKVLFWAGEFATAANFGELWDPATNAITHVPNPFSNIFCSSHVALADGRILVAGGHDLQNGILGLAKANTFDPVTETWSALPSMAFRRWYPTLTALPDGRAIVNSGSSSSESEFVDTPEIYDPVSNTWTRLTGSKLAFPQYPMMFLLPDGRLLQSGTTEYPTATRALDFGTGQWTTVDARVIDGGSAAMYQPGRILKSGSASVDGTTPSAGSATSSYVLDTSAPAPAWRETAPMAFARTFHNLTMLPDGTAVATGGSGRKSETDLAPAVLAAERWSPDTETWSTLASMQKPRLYHGSAVLLPDARVAVAGGGNIPGGTDMLSVEVLSPPYLFKGPRPVVTFAPSLVRHGATFSVETPDAASIRKVSLLRPGAATHAFDQDQRFLPLAFTAADANRLEVQAPADAKLAPPGYYMLFLVSNQGVPSVAKFVRFPAGYEDSVPPTAPSGLIASGAPGTVSLSWSAATDDSGSVSYRIHRSAISGAAPTEANLVGTTSATSYVNTGVPPGTHYYVVVASDPTGNLGAPSNQASALVPADTRFPDVALTAPADGATVLGTVTLSASASDDVGVAGVQFRLDGVPLGAEDTAPPFSYAWSTAGVANGGHVLTAVARDAAGNARESAPVDVVVANPLIAGLVASYGFEEGVGSTVADASGNGNTGTLSGGPTWTAAGLSGGALAFDGVDDRVTVPDAASLDLTTGMTVQAWVHPTATGGWRSVVMKETASNLAYALYADSPSAGPEGYANVGAVLAAQGSGELPLNAWTHLAVTYDGAMLRLYQNGVQVGTRSLAGSMTLSNAPLRIGGNAIWGESFAGRIDEVRVYDRALTPAEIAITMNEASTPPRLVVASPAEGSTVSGTAANVGYSVVGSSGELDHVHFRLDGGAELEDPAPIDGAFSLPALAPGPHALDGFLVRADHSKIAGSDAATIQFTVSTASDTTPPTVVLTSPRDGDTLQGVVTVAASASDDVGVAGVQFKLGATLLGAEDTSPPFSYAWNTASATNGSHVLSAVARDAAGNTRTSIAVGVAVANAQQIAGLRAAYGFEEGAGSTAADASGNGNTGTLSGPTWTAAGRSGGALSFDGVNDLVTVADASSLDLATGMTLEAWVFPTAAGGWRTALMKESASDLAYALYADSPSARPEGYIGSSVVQGSGALALNAWTHLATTWDGATLRLYQNGVEVGSRSLGGSIAATVRPLQIGGNAIWGEHFSGRIDEVRVYDRALTPAEIAADIDAPVVQEAQPTRSSPIAVDAAARRVWVVNPDNDSVTALGADSLAVELEIPVGRHPTSLALDGFGQVWVTCRDDDSIWILGAQSGAALSTLTLPWGSAPIGIVFAPGGADGYVAAYGSGRLHRVHAITQELGAAIAVGPTPRALAVTGDGARLLVPQFISTDGIGRVRAVDLATFTPGATVQMPLDTTSLDGSVAARGLPNYLAGIAIAPGGGEAWVAAKKDNVLRGLARDGQPLTFETTVRALVGVLDLDLDQETVGRRIDADNQSQPSAVAFSESGNHALVTLQGNDRLIAYNALGLEVVRADTGRAPQGIAIDPVTRRVFTHDFMSRTVSAFDGNALLTAGTPQLPLVARVATVSAEALAPAVLRGKQIFYDAEDTRMSRDGYISCASCHVDGDQDGQVWDFTDRGEGLRNTISLRGQGGIAGAPLHWSGNFDEVQDFEGDIRRFFGGTGLMSDAAYFAGTRSQPLGDPKAGLSSDLDALAAYVGSLTETPRSPARAPDGTMTADAVAGQALFGSLGCGSCHAGPRLSDSPSGVRHDVGTIQPSSGFRLGGLLDGIDTPMLPGLAGTAPYLHDGSAATVRDVLTTANPNGEHGALGALTAAQIDQLVAYLLQLEFDNP